MATAKRNPPAPAPAAPVQPVMAQPASKHEAAQTAGVFLATNDAWAQAYFNPNDLHDSERVLFG